LNTLASLVLGARVFNGGDSAGEGAMLRVMGTQPQRNHPSQLPDSMLPTRREFLRLCALTGAGVALGAACTSHDTAPTSPLAARDLSKENAMTPTTPTIVLIHGAFAESSSWNGVITRLLAKDHTVHAVANPLRGLQADSAYLARTLDSIAGPIVLVGHSYGGMLMNAAAGHDRVRALVYVAAFAPQRGESAGDLSGRFPGSSLGEALLKFPLGDGSQDQYIVADRFHQQFAADVPADEAAVMAATQRPIVDRALGDPAGDPAWASIPSWFIFGDLDRNIPVAAHRFMAERARARRTEEIAGGSHAIGVSQPEAVAAMIGEAVAATTTPVHAAAR
jgi:pimeloyl-ACP methyl ester carboxylesterase